MYSPDKNLKQKTGTDSGILYKKVTNVTILTIIVLLIIISGFSKDSRKPFRHYIILVSFDAFRRDYFKLYNTPNLNRLAYDAVKADHLIPSFPTKTFPNHYTIFTRLYPDQVKYLL